MREICSAANVAVEQAAHERQATSMGATLVAVLATDSHGWVAHVGDSRAYLLHGGSAVALTIDHSRVSRMVAEGVISEREARDHPERNVIERALGFEGGESTIATFDLKPGDAVLLCSDGVSNVLRPGALADIARREATPQAAADALVQAAVHAGADDNVTVALWSTHWELFRDATAPAVRRRSAATLVGKPGHYGRRRGRRAALFLALAAVVAAVVGAVLIYNTRARDVSEVTPRKVFASQAKTLAAIGAKLQEAEAAYSTVVSLVVVDLEKATDALNAARKKLAAIEGKLKSFTAAFELRPAVTAMTTALRLAEQKATAAAAAIKQGLVSKTAAGAKVDPAVAQSINSTGIAASLSSTKVVLRRIVKRQYRGYGLKPPVLAWIDVKK